MSSCENPNVDKDALMTKRQNFDGKTKLCVKCKENSGSIIIRYAVYCKSCFFPLVETRFRKTLEPSINPVQDGPRRKALKAAGSLLIAFSGGTSSTALLDLMAKTYFIQTENNINEKMKGGKEHPRNTDKVWKGRPAVCYVEVCGAFPGDSDRTEDIRSVVNSYPSSNFEFVPLRLEDSFNPIWWKSIGGGDLLSATHVGMDMTKEDLKVSDESSSSSSPLRDMQDYLKSLPTQTAFYSAIQILIRLLLLHTASSRHASHLILGTSLTSLSVNLISGISQGAGYAVADEAKEEWRPQSETPVQIVRPLRDIGIKECTIWDWWCGLIVVGKSRKIYGGGKGAIGALTRDFILGLEIDYPATVSTIARTCAKLSPKEVSNNTCMLCERPVQPGVQEWKSRISIRSYHEASQVILGNQRPPHLTEEEIADLVNSSSNLDSTISFSLTPRLCYACHTLLTSRSSRGTVDSAGQKVDHVPLPQWIRSSAFRSHADDGDINEKLEKSVKLSKANMKEQIADFLLPDEEG